MSMLCKILHIRRVVRHKTSFKKLKNVFKCMTGTSQQKPKQLLAAIASHPL